MTWRLDGAVVKGEIDNTRRNCVVGRIWLNGCEEPLKLNLEGNCWSDIAGCKLTFKNPNPQVSAVKDAKYLNMNLNHNGTVGDITASLKVRVLDVSLKEAVKMKQRGENPPEHIGNCLYMEWYSKSNGRVVVESADYELSVSDYVWRMRPEDEMDEEFTAAEWMEGFAEIMDEEFMGFDDTYEARPMNEWDWEKFMKEGDVQTEKFIHLFDEYKDHPDREQIIASEMGWTAVLGGVQSEQEWDNDLDVMDEPDPNPLTEGIDWVRDENGWIVHPLVKKARNVIVEMRSECEKDDSIDAQNTDLSTMFFEVQSMVVKLGGALNSLGFDTWMDNGFIVAYLKRTLKYFDRAMEASETVLQVGALDIERVKIFREFMFGIRSEILDLMERYRKRSG